MLPPIHRFSKCLAESPSAHTESILSPQGREICYIFFFIPGHTDLPVNEATDDATKEITLLINLTSGQGVIFMPFFLMLLCCHGKINGHRQ
jgi:hypothetical protein